MCQQKIVYKLLRHPINIGLFLFFPLLKPSPAFYVLLVLMLATSVNTGRFLEYNLEWEPGNGTAYSPHYYTNLTPLMSDSR